MKISHMTGRTGKPIANQVIVYTPGETLFKSYDTTIIKTVFEDGERVVYLDENYWDYSVTTGKYRNEFLGESKKDTERKIKEGIYKLADLN